MKLIKIKSCFHKMSLIAKQRELILEQLTQPAIMNKRIRKAGNNHLNLAKNNSQNNPGKCIDFIIRIERPISESGFFQCRVELKLALSAYSERKLGGLLESPTTYNYKVSRVDQTDDVIIYSLDLQDKNELKLDQILSLIDATKDQYAEEAKLCTIGRFKLLDEYQSKNYVTENYLQQCEQRVKGYPYLCEVQKINGNRSMYSQRVVNEKYLQMMGITKEMMFHHLKEYQALPSPFLLGEKLSAWCQLSRMSIEEKSNFETTINTYEGHHYQCQMEQLQMFIKNKNDSNSVFYIEYLVFKLDQRLENMLMNRDRLYRNKIDYFNKKNTNQEYEAYLQQTKQEPISIEYNNSKPCGFRIFE